MQESKSLYKIYSRNRIKIFNLNRYNRGNKKRNTKILYIWIIIVIAVMSYVIIYKSIEPVFKTICIDEAQAIATKVTNEESTRVMTNYKYNDMFTIEKDEAR